MFSVHIVLPSILGSSDEPTVTQTLRLPWYQNINHIVDGHYSKKKSVLDGERFLMTPACSDVLHWPEWSLQAGLSRGWSAHPAWSLQGHRLVL